MPCCGQFFLLTSQNLGWSSMVQNLFHCSLGLDQRNSPSSSTCFSCDKYASSLPPRKIKTCCCQSCEWRCIKSRAYNSDVICKDSSSTTSNLMKIILDYYRLVLMIVDYHRRKFRSQTSDNMDRWKSRYEKNQRREEQKTEDQRRERVRRKKKHISKSKCA